MELLRIFLTAAINRAVRLGDNLRERRHVLTTNRQPEALRVFLVSELSVPSDQRCCSFVKSTSDDDQNHTFLPCASGAFRGLAEEVVELHLCCIFAAPLLHFGRGLAVSWAI